MIPVAGRVAERLGKHEERWLDGCMKCANLVPTLAQQGSDVAC